MDNKSLIKSYSVFSLRDLEGVKAKYSGKLLKFDHFTDPRNLLTIASLDSSELADRIEYRLMGDRYIATDHRIKNYVKPAMESGKSLKKALKEFHSYVNAETWNLIADSLRDDCGVPKSMAGKYATKLYLRNYKKVNAAMRDVFERLVYSA